MREINFSRYVGRLLGTTPIAPWESAARPLGNPRLFFSFVRKHFRWRKFASSIKWRQARRDAACKKFGNVAKGPTQELNVGARPSPALVSGVAPHPPKKNRWRE